MFISSMATVSQDFIDSVATNVPTILAIVIPFAVGVIVWGIAKKWLFGSSGRI